MKRLKVLYSSRLDGMLVHRKVTTPPPPPPPPQNYVADTHLYTWAERDKVEQSFLSKEIMQRHRDQADEGRDKYANVGTARAQFD